MTFLQISEQVWIPVHSIVRVSVWNDVVTIITTNGTEMCGGEDAERIVKQLKPLL